MNGLPKLKSLTIGNNINSLPSFFLSGVLDSLKEIHIKNKSTEFSVKKIHLQFLKLLSSM